MRGKTVNRGKKGLFFFNIYRRFFLKMHHIVVLFKKKYIKVVLFPTILILIMRRQRQTGSGREKVSLPLAAGVFVCGGSWERHNAHLLVTICCKYRLPR